jgi:hypothetical protein
MTEFQALTGLTYLMDNLHYVQLGKQVKKDKVWKAI